MLEGPRLDPLSGARAKSLVVILHGYGADGDDLIDLGRAWAAALPDTAFVAPHAPDVCEIWAQGRQWFPLSMRDPSEYWRGVVGARPVLDAFIDAELGRLGLGDADLAIAGFSQGAMMALHAGPRRSRGIGGIAAYSGLLAGPERLAGEAMQKPPVLLVHGDEDDVVPPWHRPAAEKALLEAGFEVSSYGIADLGHGIDPGGVQLGAAFLRRVLDRSA